MYFLAVTKRKMQSVEISDMCCHCYATATRSTYEDEQEKILSIPFSLHHCYPSEPWQMAIRRNFLR